MSDSATKTAADAQPSKKKPLWQRLLPLGVILVALGLLFATGLNDYVSISALKEYRGDLIAFRNDHYALALILLIAAYAALVAISFPGAGLLTIFSGFLFGTWVGGLAVLIGATTGATIIFFVVKTSFGDALREKAGPWVKKFEQGFKEGELNYLFILRLVPAFPFWLVNIVPSVLGVSVRNYVLTTFFGIMPGTFVYASIGNGAGRTLDQGKDLDLGVIFQPYVLGPIIGLILLSLIPIIVKRVRGRKVPAPE